ncbi:MAG: amino acid racemase [Tepidanaerobacter acetatoxydans]|uniref:aspartate/glutamate racemase family protein n=1 Tax=Tepidanaerobacter acetatoxydans TaxID=499229 RepID=UPI0026E9A109|nr:amino acid racemase [Tepidanaerobacter acetatoxydans]NLU09680.1 amino acid racemase [Tepidanaerobacter acetatoxydans]
MILGILGGMGPAATSDFFRKLISYTDAKKDQEHLHIIIDNNTKIPDRTSYICGSGEDPRIEMIRSIIKLEAMGADYIAIPCNTAHYFYDDLTKYTKVKILNMIYETAIFLKDTKPDCKDYLLLATKGTYLSGIYKKIFSQIDLNIIEPSSSDKQVIMNWIYGVKSSKFDVSPIELKSLINRYYENKKVIPILGCTELPLLAQKIGLSEEYVDPVSILAKRCVDIARDDTVTSRVGLTSSMI